MRALLLLAILLAGCTLPGVLGSGEITSETRELEPFHSISLNQINAELYITQDGDHAIEIFADDNIIDLIKTEVRNGVLVIRPETANLQPSEPIRLYTSMSEVRKLTASYNGKIIAETNITCDELTLDIIGSGDIKDFNISCNKLNSLISGSGSVQVSGSADEHDTRISGSGNILASGLETNKTTATISGSGKQELYANEELFATIFGSGDIYYKGNASVTELNFGSGRITKVD